MRQEHVDSLAIIALSCVMQRSGSIVVCGREICAIIQQQFDKKRVT